MENKDIVLTEDYASFEVATLLKEAGFNHKTHVGYIDDSFMHCVDDYNPKIVTYAPTHQMMIKWIREKFGIEIVVDHCFEGDPENGIFSYFYTIDNPGDKFYYRVNSKELFNDPAVALEEGVKYYFNTYANRIKEAYV